jgi:hypothetical protein
MVGLGLPPKKQAKGNRNNPNRDILEDVNQLARNGWQSIPNCRHIMWQVNTLIDGTSTNFDQCKSMAFMSKTMQPILVVIGTIV